MLLVEDVKAKCYTYRKMPGWAGMMANEEGTVVWRAYLDPVFRTGADPAEVILDRTIKFGPKP